MYLVRMCLICKTHHHTTDIQYIINTVCRLLYVGMGFCGVLCERAEKRKCFTMFRIGVWCFTRETITCFHTLCVLAHRKYCNPYTESCACFSIETTDVCAGVGKDTLSVATLKIYSTLRIIICQTRFSRIDRFSIIQWV